MLEFDTMRGEGKNYTGYIIMKTLMNTAMKTIMKSSLCAIVAVVLSTTATLADSTCSVNKPVGAIADLTTSTSGEVDSYSGTYGNDYPPSAVFDDVLPLDDSTKYNRALIPDATGSSVAASPRWVVYKFNDATAVNAIGILSSAQPLPSGLSSRS